MDNLQLQQTLISWGLLDPPADGLFGGQSKAALSYACQLCGVPESPQGIADKVDPIPLHLDNSFASRIVKYMIAKGYHISKGERLYNIVYVEGENDDGTPNADTPNYFNDLRMIIEIKRDGIPKIIGMWNATTEPGDYYTLHPMNPDGAFRIAFGQYKAWQVGIHKDHEALIQCGEISGYRDANEDYMRTGDKLVTGSDFCVDQHWGYDFDLVGRASAGCLVGRTRSGHREFMKLVKSDRRYEASDSYVFLTTIIAGDDLARTFPI